MKFLLAQAVYEGDTKLIEELYPDFPRSEPIYAVVDKSKKRNSRILAMDESEQQTNQPPSGSENVMVLPVCPEEGSSTARSSKSSTPAAGLPAVGSATTSHVGLVAPPVAARVLQRTSSSNLQTSVDLPKKDEQSPTNSIGAKDEIQEKEVTVASSSVIFVRQASSSEQMMPSSTKSGKTK